MRIYFLILACCIIDGASSRAASPPITALAFSPNGKHVVAGSQAGVELRAWPTLEKTDVLRSELSHVHDLAFSPDGAMLAVAGGSPAEFGAVEIFRWPERELLRRFRPHNDSIFSIRWKRDASALATASADGAAAVHDAASGKMLHKFDGHSRPVLAVLYLANDETLASAGVDETIRLWNAASGEAFRALANHTRSVHALALHPSSDDDENAMLASAGDDRTVRFWQPVRGRLVRFARLESIPRAIAWTADGRTLVVACHDGRVRTIDPETAEVVSDRPALDGVAYCLAIAPNGDVLVGGENGQLRKITTR